MNTEFYNKRYKDRNPLDTINLIKNILKEIGIRTEEKFGDSGVGTYWVHIRGFYKNVFVGASNGKGSAKEFALASGYAEFMERLQNQLQSCNITPMTTVFFEGNNDFRFLCHKDEKYLSVDEAVDSSGDIANSLIDIFGKEYYRNILKYSVRNIFDKKALVCIPFRKLEDDSYIEYLPQTIRAGNLGSNGMCAGNTKEEALTQGISEIFERYVQIQISNHDIDVPTIPNEDIKHLNEELYNIIQNIERSGEYKVVVKECSLYSGFPVMAVIVINKKTKKYYVNFGASPVFDIALERCLTETFQGADLKILEDRMLPLTCFGEQDANRENDVHLVVNGIGFYNSRFILGDNHNYTLEHFSKKESNTDFLKYYIDLCHKNNTSIYYADMSHLGFPTYHIYIPGFTFINTDSDICQAEENTFEAIYFLKDKKLKDYKNNLRQMTNIFRTIEASNNELIKLFIQSTLLTMKRLKYDYLKENGLFTYLKFATFLCSKNYTLAIEPFEEYVRLLEDYIRTENRNDENLRKHLEKMYLLRTFLTFAIRHQEYMLLNSPMFTDEEKELFRSIINGGNEIKELLFDDDIVFDEEKSKDLIEFFITYSNYQK